MATLCETRPATGSNTTPSPWQSRKASLAHAPSDGTLTSGESLAPIRTIVVPVAPGPTRQRYNRKRSQESSKPYDRRKSTRNNGSYSADSLKHSKSADTISKNHRSKDKLTHWGTAPNPRTSNTRTSRHNSTATKLQRSKSGSLREALKSIFSRQSEDKVAMQQEPLYNLSRELSPNDVGGILRGPRTPQSSVPRFVPVRTVHDIPLGISFSDRLFVTPNNYRNPFGSINNNNTLTPVETNQSQGSVLFRSNTNRSKTASSYRPGPSESYTFTRPGAQSRQTSRKGRDGLRRKLSSAKTSEEMLVEETGYTPTAGRSTATTPRAASPVNLPQPLLIKRPSAGHRARQDSLDAVQERHSGENVVRSSLDKTKGASMERKRLITMPSSPQLRPLPKNPFSLKSAMRTTSTSVMQRPPQSHALQASPLFQRKQQSQPEQPVSGISTAPRAAMEAASFAARLQELESRMTVMEKAHQKLKHQHHRGHVIVERRGSSNESTANTATQSYITPPPSHRDSFGENHNNSWFLGESGASSRDSSAPPTPPLTAESSPMQHKGLPASLNDSFNHPVAKSQAELDYLRHELSLLRRYDSTSTVATALFAENTADMHHLERVTAPRSGVSGTPYVFPGPISALNSPRGSGAMANIASDSKVDSTAVTPTPPRSAESSKSADVEHPLVHISTDSTVPEAFLDAHMADLHELERVAAPGYANHDHPFLEPKALLLSGNHSRSPSPLRPVMRSMHSHSTLAHDDAHEQDAEGGEIMHSITRVPALQHNDLTTSWTHGGHSHLLHHYASHSTINSHDEHCHDFHDLERCVNTAGLPVPCPENGGYLTSPASAGSSGYFDDVPVELGLVPDRPAKFKHEEPSSRFSFYDSEEEEDEDEEEEVDEDGYASEDQGVIETFTFPQAARSGPAASKQKRTLGEEVLEQVNVEVVRLPSGMGMADFGLERPLLRRASSAPSLDVGSAKMLQAVERRLEMPVQFVGIDWSRGGGSGGSEGGAGARSSA